jgi:hypothetical protein
MRRILFSLLATAGLVTAGAHHASAAPANGAAPGAIAAPSETLTLVRDGCGPDRHYSHYHGICVWDPPQYRAYGHGPYYRHYGPPAVYAPAYGYYAVPYVAYGPPPTDYYIDPNGTYASTVIHNPRGRYFDLWYD